MSELRIPGPTPCPEEVLKILNQQMINHRGDEFAELIGSVTERLKIVFFTKNDVLTLTSSGTGAMEASIVNFLSPGDKVLATSIGYFGNRFAEIAERHSIDVVKFHEPWGEELHTESLEWALELFPEVKAVLLTHNETSTGVTNKLDKLAEVVKRHNKLTIVDAISSLSAIPLYTDLWGLDVVMSASQKGWMSPPGLAMISVSPRAWEYYKNSQMSKFYFDLGTVKSFLDKRQTPWTPAISIYFALDVALDLILKEGIDNVFGRHRRVAKRLRDGARSIGLELLVPDEIASTSLTTIKIPQGVDGNHLIHLLKEKYDIVVGEGVGEFVGKIIRVGHMGMVNEGDMDRVIKALKNLLNR